MMQISAQMVSDAVSCAIPYLACRLSRDVSEKLEDSARRETVPAASGALGLLCKNACVAASDGVPLCQDTGYVWVCLEIGPEVSLKGDVFSGVDEAVAQAYARCGLRKSMVCDALENRTNTGDNTPAQKEIILCEVGRADEARLHIMLKGGGSDNASRVVMLAPGAGKQGIIDAVRSCVIEKATSACPPLTVGIGVGGSFDKVASLAKHALLRPVGQPSLQPEAAQLERELFAMINGLEIGAAGLGGEATAFAVHVETAPCHIAALPLAINLGCSALRRVSLDLGSSCSVEEQLEGAFPLPAWTEQDIDEALSSENQDPRALQLPLSKADLSQLKQGDCCTLSGPLFLLRDAGHQRLLAELEQEGRLPYGLEGQAIFYAGPTPPAAGRPFGAVGPTTSGRMDFAAPALYDAGIVATIGKGRRSDAVAQSCKANSAVYFSAVGGAAAYLARCVSESQVVAYDDLGTEALRRVIVNDFPVVVAIDSQGECKECTDGK